jgi:hypothetical protein
MTTVSDGTEWLVVRLERHERWGWSVDQAGETHAELREALEETDLLGYEVAVGPFPPVLDTSDDVLEAIVPFPHGRTVRGIY